MSALGTRELRHRRGAADWTRVRSRFSVHHWTGRALLAKADKGVVFVTLGMPGRRGTGGAKCAAQQRCEDAGSR